MSDYRLIRILFCFTIVGAGVRYEQEKQQFDYLNFELLIERAGHAYVARGAPELADLPWEYLYNAALNRFLVLAVETPLVRYIELPERIRPLAVQPPLKIIVMLSSPADYPQLDGGKSFPETTGRSLYLHGVLKRGRLK